MKDLHEAFSVKDARLARQFIQAMKSINYVTMVETQGQGQDTFRTTKMNPVQYSFGKKSALSLSINSDGASRTLTLLSGDNTLSANFSDASNEVVCTLSDKRFKGTCVDNPKLKKSLQAIAQSVESACDI